MADRTTTGPAVLAAEGLTLWRGTLCLFESLSFDIQPGQLLTVTGPNGSGKTTLLRVLAGLTRPENGRVCWRGTDIDSDRQRFGAEATYLGHRNGLKFDLTVTQNLEFAARLDGRPAADVAESLDALNLSDCAGLAVRYLSAGQQRRTALARLLMSGATLWLLDEPLTNLDAAGRAFVKTRLGAHTGSGGMVVDATHETLELDGAESRQIRLGDPP